MSQASPRTVVRGAPLPKGEPLPPPAEPSPGSTLPGAPLALAGALLAFLLYPPVRENPRLAWTFTGLAAALSAWSGILWASARRTGRVFRIELVPVSSHYVQAAVQLSILAYWGWFVPSVPAEAPFILAQVLFVYALEALLTWSRGRTWRLGFGPLPIVFSTNLLLWFKHDWYFLQFLMLSTGAIAKQFITWRRDGRQVHVFNPSAFGQFVFALGLIATGTTYELTWGKEIATTFETPHMLVVIFVLGLVVQYLFQVTLMTAGAAAALFAVSLVFHGFTGTYFFVNANIAAPIFLGLHLLITDPATSPRTSAGRLVFGALYGLSYAALFRILDSLEIPLFWDKLLPVPILNLCVPLIDRWARTGLAGRVNRWWETALEPRRLNLVHMGGWAALFLTALFTGFVDAPHPGDSISFWKEAYAQGKPFAGGSLVMAAGAQAEGGGSSAAFNELGLICIEGKIVNENHGTAARYFAKACEMGNLSGCANVASQSLFLHERRSDEDVARALSQLERACEGQADPKVFYLVGAAYETGRGRPMDQRRASELYERCGPADLHACKGLARIGLSEEGSFYDLRRVASLMQAASQADDEECCWYLAYMYLSGRGVERDPARARALLEQACRLGSADACEALKQAVLPPFERPIMSVPGWSTDFPLSPLS